MTPKQKSLYFRTWAQVRRLVPTADRHALHIAALGHDKSSKQFTNRDLDLVLAEFYKITQPNSVDTQLKQLRMTRTRAEHTCSTAPATYVMSVCRDKFGTRHWQSLSTPQLCQLAMTLHNRDIAPVTQAAQSALSQAAQSALSQAASLPTPEPADCPF